MYSRGFVQPGRTVVSVLGMAATYLPHACSYPALRAFNKNSVHGVRKARRQLKRKGFELPVARCRD